MARYWLNTKTNPLSGDIISLGLIRDDGSSLYIAAQPVMQEDWSKENVTQNLTTLPVKMYPVEDFYTDEASLLLEAYFDGDLTIEVVSNGVDHIGSLAELLIKQDGQMVNIPRIRFIMERSLAAPPELPGVDPLPGNAWYDALALRMLYTDQSNYYTNDLTNI